MIKLVYIFSQLDQPIRRIELEGLLKLHIRNCNMKLIDDNICTQLARDILKEDDVVDKTRQWYLFIKTLIVDALERFPKSGRLHMLYAFIQHEKLKNRYKALFEMMITEESKPNIQEEFSIYRHKDIIEEEMIENDMRNTETKGLDVNIIVHFQNKFVIFQNNVERAVNLHLDFWRELMEDSPDIHKLQSLGSKITNQVEVTTDQFKKLNQINPNHIKCLVIYGNFLKDIVNDDQEGLRIIEKAEYVDKSAMVNKQFIDNDRLKYGENSNTCIFTCSGNFNEMGVVKNVNNEITRVFGLSKAEIMENNISVIMPKVIADSHDSFMMNYFETSESKIIGAERLVFPMTKAGYLVPCTLMVKILPNLEEGIKIVGFLKDIETGTSYMKNDFDTEEKVHYIMYGGENELVHGITASCFSSFGIPSSLVYGNNSIHNELSIDAIIPELAEQNFDDLKSPSGVIITIDTTNLQQEYMLGMANSSDDNEYSNDEDSEDGSE